MFWPHFRQRRAPPATRGSWPSTRPGHRHRTDSRSALPRRPGGGCPARRPGCRRRIRRPRPPWPPWPRPGRFPAPRCPCSRRIMPSWPRHGPSCRLARAQGKQPVGIVAKPAACRAALRPLFAFPDAGPGCACRGRCGRVQRGGCALDRRSRGGGRSLGRRTALGGIVRAGGRDLKPGVAIGIPAEGRCRQAHGRGHLALVHLVGGRGVQPGGVAGRQQRQGRQGTGKSKAAVRFNLSMESNAPSLSRNRRRAFTRSGNGRRGAR